MGDGDRRRSQRDGYLDLQYMWGRPARLCGLKRRFCPEIRCDGEARKKLWWWNVCSPSRFVRGPVGNVWIVDGYGGPGAPEEAGKGHQVVKFSPDGELLLALGTADVKGDTPTTFHAPSDVVVASNGDIFVADGHGGETNHRIVKFTKDGKFVKSWGTKGNGPGQFNETHSLALDSKGRLLVGDRRNNRIQIFDQGGVFLDEWRQFGDPSEVFIDSNDVIHVADSGTMTNPDAKRGVYIGRAADGQVTGFISDDTERRRNQKLVVVDHSGNRMDRVHVGQDNPKARKEVVGNRDRAIDSYGLPRARRRWCRREKEVYRTRFPRHIFVLCRLA